MAIKFYKPTSPGRRFMSVSAYEEITCTTPEKSLLEDKRSTGGRNVHGKITVRFRGGAARRKYRIIDFKRNKDGIPAKVVTIEYDPNRSANIALLVYADGEKRYIIAPYGLHVGDTILSGPEADIKPGNAAQLMAKEGAWAQVRLPSGEVRMIPMGCKATIGQVGNLEHENIKLGKAGKTRHLGIRPTVRGSVMNPVDHPHGGGEGRSPIGRPSPVTPWGKPTLGYKTRNKKARTDKFIVKRRNDK